MERAKPLFAQGWIPHRPALEYGPYRGSLAAAESLTDWRMRRPFLELGGEEKWLKCLHDPQTPEANRLGAATSVAEEVRECLEQKTSLIVPQNELELLSATFLQP